MYTKQWKNSFNEIHWEEVLKSIIPKNPILIYIILIKTNNFIGGNEMKKVLSVILALCMVVSLAACSNSTSTKEESGSETSNATTAADKSTPAEKIEITVWRAAGSDTENEAYDNVFDNFNASQDEITVKYETLQAGSAYGDQVRAAAVSGDLPDILLVDGPEMASLCYAAVLAPLDEFITPEFKNDLLPSIIEQGTYKDGKVYLLGQFDGGLALWANKEMLQSANVRIPNGIDDAWTKDEFNSALESLKKLPGIEYPLDMKVNYGTGYWIYSYLPIIKSFGGDVMDRSTMVADGTLNGDSTIQAFDYLAELVNKGYVNKAQTTDDDFFGTKTAALSLSGHWMAPNMIEALGDNAILIPLPDFGNGVYTGTGSLAWGMTTKAVEDGVQKEAYDVIMSLFTEEAQKSMFAANGAIPSRISVLNTIPEYQEGGKYYLYREQLEKGCGVVRPITPAFSVVQNTLGTAAVDIMNGADVKKTLDSTASEIDSAIKEAGYNQ